MRNRLRLIPRILLFSADRPPFEKNILFGLKMNAEGIRGQGNGLSQKLVSRKGLAAERIADQNQR